MSAVLLSALSAWAPGIDTAQAWQEWAKGEMAQTSADMKKDAPSLKGFTDGLFRRRLSQISRMTIQVVHDTAMAAGVAEKMADVPVVFVSMRGEVSRQAAVSQMLVSEKEVLPASFSLSVFNAPVALAAIALNLHGGYTAVYPAGGNFKAAFTQAAAMVLSKRPKAGGSGKVLLAYADEAIPDEYSTLASADDGKGIEPLAFACILQAADGNGAENAILVESADVEESAALFLSRIMRLG